MTTVGYGDLSPKNERERIICIFASLFSCINYGLVLGKVA